MIVTRFTQRPERVDGPVLIQELATAGLAVEEVGIDAQGHLVLWHLVEWTEYEIDQAAQVIAAHDPPPPPTPEQILAQQAIDAMLAPREGTPLAARAAIRVLYQSLTETRAALNQLRADLASAGIPIHVSPLVNRTWEQAIEAVGQQIVAELQTMAE